MHTLFSDVLSNQDFFFFFFRTFFWLYCLYIGKIHNPMHYASLNDDRAYIPLIQGFNQISQGERSEQRKMRVGGWQSFNMMLLKIFSYTTERCAGALSCNRWIQRTLACGRFVTRCCITELTPSKIYSINAKIWCVHNATDSFVIYDSFFQAFWGLCLKHSKELWGFCIRMVPLLFWRQ